MRTGTIVNKTIDYPFYSFPKGLKLCINFTKIRPHEKSLKVKKLESPICCL